MDYTEVRFYNDASLNEAIIAWLGENDFDMFEEREDGLNAYIEARSFNEENLKDILSHIPGAIENIRYETEFIKDQNWNSKWESNFEPVLIANRVYVRAPFHEPKINSEFEIIIEPKMSFGTGHHATTSLMMTMMLAMDFRNKKVLDIGSGTGILSILAEKLGASFITAIDIEEWAYNNCLENCEKNNSLKISVLRGDISLARNMQFDIILANINRNILLTDIPDYSSCLNSSGEILFSGILVDDKEIIDRRARESGLIFIQQAMQENWLALRYKKNSI
jgi:ribosomal protein L11 methyltransferase